MKKYMYVIVAFFIFFSCEKENNTDKKDDDSLINDTTDNNPSNDVLFTAGTGVTDINGNSYSTVKINLDYDDSKFENEQEWMAENLRATKYADGTDIPSVNMAACNNDETTVEDLGYLYNWDALMKNSTVAGSQGACPDGWHVPTVAEFDILITALGGINEAGKKLKSTDSKYWTDTTFADNSSGFNAHGGGYMLQGMVAFYKGVAKFWTSTEEGANGREVQIEGDGNYIFNSYGSSKTAVKSSCRCIKNVQ